MPISDVLDAVDALKQKVSALDQSRKDLTLRTQELTAAEENKATAASAALSAETDAEAALATLISLAGAEGIDLT